VDSNGAGDNYFSGFLYAWLQEKPLRDCMRYGTICGGLCITSSQLVAEELSGELLEEQYSKYYWD
jgi:acarbose 7IV-phosphotransferase